MPFVPVPATVMAEIRMTLFGQKIENTLYFQFLDAPSVLAMEGLGSDLLDWWTTLYDLCVTEDVILREVFLTSLDSAISPTATVTPEGTVTGAISENANPGNVAACVSFRTANRGRSYRGRNYVSGLARTDVAGNTIGAGLAGRLLDAYDFLNVTYNSLVSGRWSVVSRFTAGVAREEGVVTPITSVVLTDLNLDSMRRRLIGRGE